LHDDHRDPLMIACSDGFLYFRVKEGAAKAIHLQAELNGIDAKGAIDRKNQGEVDAGILGLTRRLWQKQRQ
jgi:hypothetical protein